MNTLRDRKRIFLSEEDKTKRKKIWPIRAKGATRIESLAEGVLAVAMTLLILELSNNPEFMEKLAAGRLLDVSEQIYGYILGFLIIGVYWAVHHHMFHYIRRSDGILVWLSIIFLLFAVVVPIGTKLNSYPEYQTTFSLVFFSSTSLISILLLLVIWVYATSGNRLVDKDLDKHTILFVKKVILIGSGIFIISIVGSFIIPEFGYIGILSLVYMIVATAFGDNIPFLKR
jgi:uncharacterized membrane protein